MLDIVIERRTGIQLYLQIVNQIIYAISTNLIEPNEKLPSIRALAAQLGVAAATVHHAYRQLENGGYIVSHQGKGVFVANFYIRNQDNDLALSTQLVTLFLSAIERAYSMGASPHEISESWHRALSQWEGRSKVVFVSTDIRFLDYYEPLLSAALKDLNIELVPVLLTEQARNVFDPTSPPICIVTMVRSYSKLREMLTDIKIPLVPLALKLSDETKQKLLSLPKDGIICLVAESHNIVGMRHSVEQYLAMDTLVNCSSSDAKLDETAGRATIIIHSLAVRNIVEKYAAHAQLIEVHFVPDEFSLERIREEVDFSRQMGNWKADAAVANV